MPRYGNIYGPQTPYGRGLNNIAVALLAGRDRGGADPAARDDMNLALGELYREQARKAAAETALAKSLTDARSYDSVTDAAAAAAEMPGYTFRSIHEASRGAGDLSQYSPEEIGRYRRSWASYAPGYADKTVSPEAIAQALKLHRAEADRRGIIAGTQDPTRTGQAHFATSGRAPFDNMGGTGTFNLLTGVQEINDVGRSRAGAEGARAEASAAQGRASDALARQRDTETRAGVRLGPPVLVDDIEQGPMYTSPLAAVNRPPAARPVDRPPAPPREPVVRPPAPPRPLDQTRRVNNLLQAFPEGVREQLRTEVMERVLAGDADTAIFGDIQPRITQGTLWGHNVAPRTVPGAPQTVSAPSGAVYIAPSGKRYTGADVQTTARNRGLTPEQVIQQLRLRQGA